jgi:hypothetical protein
MATDTQIPEKTNQIDVKHIFQKLRDEVEQVTSRENLDKLYKRTGYMITLTHSIPIQENYSGPLTAQRRMAEEEFTKTVRKINEHAKKIGTQADYNEKWDELTINNEAEEADQLEAKSADDQVVNRLDEATKLQGRGF